MRVVDALNPMNSPVMPAEWARDQRLSFGARGVLAELIDTPPEGEMSVDRLVRTDAWENAEVIEGYLVELESVGYLVRDGQCGFLYDPVPFTEK